MFLVIGLVSAVVIIFHRCVLPFVLDNYSTTYAYLHLFYGHYLLIMICFHYFKGVTTKSKASTNVCIMLQPICLSKRKT